MALDLRAGISRCTDRQRHPMQDAEVTIKPRDVMPEGAHDAAGARSTSIAACFEREMDRLFARDVDLRRADRAGRGARASSSSASCSARASSSRAAPSAGAMRSTTSAGIAAPAVHGAARARFAGSIQCPYHAWTYDLDGRLIGAPHMDEVPHFRKDDYPLHRVARRRLGRAHLHQPRRQRRGRSTTQLGELPGKFRPGGCRTCASATASSTTCKRQLEADRPELQRVPALPEPAPGAQQAVALPERRERAAAADLHGRTDGPAPGRRHDVDGRHLPARVPAGPVSRGAAAASTTTRSFPNMLLSLHPDYMMVHTLWPLAPDRTINICEWHFQPQELARAGLRCRRRDRVLGHDEPAGLARLRAVAGGDLVARLHAGPVLEPRGPALRVRPDDRGVARRG